MTEAQAAEVEAIIKALNPVAEVIPTSRSQVPLERVLDTKLFDYEKAESSAGWIKELQGEHTPETEEYGISSFTYRTAKPFDADKLHAYINDADNGRASVPKGFFNGTTASPTWACGRREQRGCHRDVGGDAARVLDS